jgi:hypothetical protein
MTHGNMQGGWESSLRSVTEMCGRLRRLTRLFAVTTASAVDGWSIERILCAERECRAERYICGLKTTLLHVMRQWKVGRGGKWYKGREREVCRAIGKV